MKLVSVVVYRLFFHPLAKYPGPFWARITQWPEGISAWRLRRHLDLQQLHERYGDVVRISPNSLSFRTREAWDNIYSDRQANMIKTGWTDAAVLSDPPNTLVFSDRKLHAARRKILNHGFSDNAIKSMEDAVVEKIRKWCEIIAQPKLEEKQDDWSQERDMAAWSSYLTTDILGELCFADDFGSLKNGGSIWTVAVPAVMTLITKVRALACISKFV
jgi:cytochrome P450